MVAQWLAAEMFRASAIHCHVSNTAHICTNSCNFSCKLASATTIANVAYDTIDTRVGILPLSEDLPQVWHQSQLLQPLKA